MHQHVLRRGVAGHAGHVAVAAIGNLTLADHLEMLNEQPTTRYHESKLARSLGLCLRLIGLPNSRSTACPERSGGLRSAVWTSGSGVSLPSHAGVRTGPLHCPGTAGGICVHRADRCLPAEHATTPSKGRQASDEPACLRQRPGRLDEGASRS